MKFWIIISSVGLSVILGSVLGAALSVAANNGLFAEWQPLTAPPAAAVKILGANIYPGVIYIQTANGQVYSCDRLATSAQCWVETTWPQPLQTDPFASECTPSHFPLPNPPGQVVDQTEVKACLIEGMLLEDYIVLADGSVWELGHSSNANLVVGYTCYFGPAIGLAFGLLIATGLYLAPKFKAFVTRPLNPN